MQGLICSPHPHHLWAECNVWPLGPNSNTHLEKFQKQQAKYEPVHQMTLELMFILLGMTVVGCFLKVFTC